MADILKNTFKEQLKARILSGELKPGDRLPPERELAAEAGISRGSVNQGILDLERMGFLHVVPRKGTFVAEYVRNATPQTLSAIMNYDSALVDAGLFHDLMSMRILIECECVRLACENMNAENGQLLEAATAKIYSAADDRLVDALYEYHRTLVRIGGNSAYVLIFQSFELMLRNMIRTHYENREQAEKCLPLYGCISSAIEARRADDAEAAIRRLLTMGSEYLDIRLS